MISILKKLKHHSKLLELYKFVTGRIEEAQLKQVASTLTLTTILSIVPAIAVIMAPRTIQRTNHGIYQRICRKGNRAHYLRCSWSCCIGYSLYRND